MPLNLDAILSGSTVIPVSWKGEAVNVTYKLDQWTPEHTQAHAERVRKLAEEKTPNPLDVAFLERFCDTVIDWDVMLKGKKVPLTVDGVKPVPWPLLNAIYDAIEEDRKAGEKTPKLLVS